MNRKIAGAPQATPKKGRNDQITEEEPLPENGHDIFTTQTGARYEGDWKRFEGVVKRHGKGEFKTEDFVYEGDFEEDLFHGHGILKYSEGSVYEGEFIHGQITGEGQMVFADNSIYRGQWRNGRMHGIGTFQTIDGQSWTGAWCHGMSTCPIFPQMIPEPVEEEEEDQGYME